MSKNGGGKLQIQLPVGKGKTKKHPSVRINLHPKIDEILARSLRHYQDSVS